MTLSYCHHNCHRYSRHVTVTDTVTNDTVIFSSVVVIIITVISIVLITINHLKLIM